MKLVLVVVHVRGGDVRVAELAAHEASALRLAFHTADLFVGGQIHLNVVIVAFVLEKEDALAADFGGFMKAREGIEVSAVRSELAPPGELFGLLGAAAATGGQRRARLNVVDFTRVLVLEHDVLGRKRGGTGGVRGSHEQERQGHREQQDQARKIRGTRVTIFVIQHGSLVF